MKTRSCFKNINQLILWVIRCFLTPSSQYCMREMTSLPSICQILDAGNSNILVKTVKITPLLSHLLKYWNHINSNHIYWNTKLISVFYNWMTDKNDSIQFAEKLTSISRDRTFFKAIMVDILNWTFCRLFGLLATSWLISM